MRNAARTFRPRILVVNDSEEVHDSIEAALATFDGIVLRACSGPDALHMTIDCEELAVVVVDVIDVGLPGMSAYEFAELLRERPGFLTTPIIFVSGEAIGRQRLRGCGSAVDHIFKPVDPQMLRSKVSAIVALHRQADEQARDAELLDQRDAARVAELAASNQALRTALREREADVRGLAEHQSQCQAQHQEELVEQERLAAIGTTVATFAHEVGNLFNNMYLQMQLLERQLTRERGQAGGAERGSLAVIMGEMRRLTVLLSEFRELARRQDIQLVPTPLAAIVADAVQVQMPGFEAQGVKVVQRLSASPIVMADPDKLDRAFVNLCKNAIEAMPEGGTLTVSLDNTGTEARLRVQDTGVGIPDSVEIFKPFATTKRSGTGLGLSIVRQIVEIHAGKLTYESELGVGTTFEIALPLAPSCWPPLGA